MPAVPLRGRSRSTCSGKTSVTAARPIRVKGSGVALIPPRATPATPREQDRMPWHTSTRRQRLPPDWPRTRTRILKRDGHRCTVLTDGQRCTQPATDVHHLGNSQDHQDHMLTSICAWHHKQETAKEAATARAQHPTPTTRRQPEPHPGMHPHA